MTIITIILERGKKMLDKAGSIDKLVEALDVIMLIDGVFNYDAAMQRLDEMKRRREIFPAEYVVLIEACKRRDEDGHYRKSKIYTRVLAGDQKS